MTYRPSWFLAAITTGVAPSERDAPVLPRSRPGSAVRHELRSASLQVRLAAAPTTDVALTADARKAVVLHGELYPAQDDAARRLLELYMRGGLGALRGLEGSFALFLFDGDRDRAAVVTDRVGSRKVFSSRRGGVEWLSTFHAFDRHPVGGRLDPVGVAHYLVNGIPLNYRTLFEGVRVLDRGSVHTLEEPGDWSREPYWIGAFRGLDGRSERALREELAGRVLEAVRRRVRSGQTNFISLTAGHDSLPILGSLTRLGAGTLRCFTYEAPGDSGHEAEVARRSAAACGQPHVTVPSHQAGLVDVLRENARRGHGLTRLTIETDAWDELAPALDADAPAAVWVGEEAMGYFDADLRSGRDALARVGILGWQSVRWMERLLPAEAGGRLRESLEEDLERMLARVPESEGWHDVKDFCYLDQRIGRLMAWREGFAGSHAEVRAPLLDGAVLDFVRRLPVEHRIEKRLWRRTGTEMFPELLAAPRPPGDAWRVRAWVRRALDEEEARARDLATRGTSPLDDLVPPDLLLRLLDRRSRRLAPSRRARRLRDGLVRRGRRFRRSLTPRRRTGTGLPPYKTVGEDILVIRGLFLRALLQERTSDGASEAASDASAGDGAGGASVRATTVSGVVGSRALA